MDTPAADFPATLQIDYPDRDLDRVTTFFRPFTIIPIAILLALVSGPSSRSEASRYALESGGIVFLPTMLMLLFRGKYPRWWFDWNVALTRFGLRVTAYLALLRDEYPSTDDEQAVHLDVPYPEAARLSRGLPLVKWLLAIPHYVVLGVLSLAAVGAVLVAWLAVLFTGRYPRGLFAFVEGVLRWWVRVLAYGFLLTTDRYPPFRLAA